MLQTYEFDKLLPANTQLNIYLEGTWSINEYEIFGTIFSIYPGINGTTYNESQLFRAQVFMINSKIDMDFIRLNNFFR